MRAARLLVDTLFDLNLTALMLDAMSPFTEAAPVNSLVNTHANGDHCYGNSEVVTKWPTVEIVASTATAHEMPEVPPSMLNALNQAPGEVGDLFRSFFGEFDFGGIELVLPTRTFDDRLNIDVAGRAVELIEVGPAHTSGDVIVHVPDASTVYTGDILFIGGTTDRLGRSSVELDCGMRSNARHGRAHSRAWSRSNHRSGPGSSTFATTLRSSIPKPPAAMMQASMRSKRPAILPGSSKSRRVSVNSANTGELR